MPTASKLKTLDDLLNYPEESRLELIAGRIVERGMPRPQHAQPQRKIGAVLDPFGNKHGYGGGGGWWILSEIGVYYDLHNSCVHDLAGWRRSRLPILPDESFIKTMPDWVCEILSPGGHRRDTVDKLKLLQRFEVPFYWVVDPDEQTLTAYKLSDQGYVVSGVAQSGERARLAPFGKIELVVEALFGIDSDEAE